MFFLQSLRSTLLAKRRHHCLSASSALRNRAFRDSMLTLLISDFGNRLNEFAIIYLTAKLANGDITTIGYAVVLGYLPSSVTSMTLGGRVADRFPRHQVVFWVQCALTLQALAFCGLQLAGATRVYMLYGTQFLGSAASGLNGPAQDALSQALVGGKALRNGRAWNAARTTLAIVFSALLAAIGFRGGGNLWWIFLVNALSFGPLLWFLHRIEKRGYKKGETEAKQKQGMASHTQHPVQGNVKAIIRKPVIWITLTASALVTVSASNGKVVQPAFALKVLNSSYAYPLITLANAVGGFAGALTLAALESQKASVLRMIGWAVPYSGFGMLYSLAGRLDLVMLWQFLATFAAWGFIIEADALISQEVPQHLWGRVNGIHQGIRGGGAAASNLIASLLIPHLGVRIISLSGFAIVLASVALCGWFYHTFARR